jgi:hypothetical protein
MSMKAGRTNSLILRLTVEGGVTIYLDLVPRAVSRPADCMKTRLITYSLVAILLLHTVGCSLYLNEPVTFRVRDAETQQPIEGAKITTRYMAMLDFGVLLSNSTALV